METEGLSNQSSSTKLIGGMNIPHFFLLSSPPNHGLLLLLDYFHLCRNLLTTFLPTRQQGCDRGRQGVGKLLSSLSSSIFRFGARLLIAVKAEATTQKNRNRIETRWIISRLPNMTLWIVQPWNERGGKGVGHTPDMRQP